MVSSRISIFIPNLAVQVMLTRNYITGSLNNNICMPVNLNTSYTWNSIQAMNIDNGIRDTENYFFWITTFS